MNGSPVHSFPSLFLRQAAVVMDASLELLGEIDALLKEENHKDALIKCDRVLKIAPNDADVLRIKLVCHIDQAQYTEALALLDSRADLSSSCAFERAYCLYSLHRNAEALAVLQEGGDTSQHALLAAQVHYRLGGHSEAARLLREAAESAPPSAELNTNVLAALISAGRSREALEHAEGVEESGFELYYNRACAAIEVGELTEAKRLLGLALTTCREALDTDEYTDQEIEVELGVLTAQAAYVDQQRGDTEEASKAYEVLHSFKHEMEPAVSAVTANNIVAMRGGDHDLFDSWKKCKGNVYNEELTRKATSKQRRAFLFNGALLSMYMNKNAQTKELLAILSSEFPGSSDPALIHAAMAVRSKQKSNEAEQILTEAAANSDDPRPALTLAQLQLRAKQPELAVSTLETISTLSSSLAMVGSRVSLYERLGNIDAAAKALEGAGEAPALLQSSANFYVRHGRWREAAKAYKRLLDANPRDLQVLAGLIVATSHFDADAAHDLKCKLDTCFALDQDEDMPELDAEQLEQASLPRAGSRARDDPARKRDASASGDTPSDPATARPKKKRRSRKKVILPKGFDPEHPGPPPDPERWLPKQERSNYRARRKDKRSGISRGPQGSTAGQARPADRTTTNLKTTSEEERVRAKAADEAKARSEAAQAAAVASGGAGKKKGKKGKR